MQIKRLPAVDYGAQLSLKSPVRALSKKADWVQTIARWTLNVRLPPMIVMSENLSFRSSLDRDEYRLHDRITSMSSFSSFRCSRLVDDGSRRTPLAETEASQFMVQDLPRWCRLTDVTLMRAMFGPDRPVWVSEGEMFEDSEPVVELPCRRKWMAISTKEVTQQREEMTDDGTRSKTPAWKACFGRRAKNLATARNPHCIRPQGLFSRKTRKREEAR